MSWNFLSKFQSVDTTDLVTKLLSFWIASHGYGALQFFFNNVQVIYNRIENVALITPRK